MKQYVLMPQMGESIVTGTITKWHYKQGDEIKEDEILLEISTDKVESEIPSPFSGRIESLLFNESDTVDVGAKIAIIEDDLSVAISKSNQSDNSNNSQVLSTPSSLPSNNELPEIPISTNEIEHLKTDSFKTSSNISSKTSSKFLTKRFYTPLVRAMAKESGVELSELENLSGTGAGGRVNKNDFEIYLNQRNTSEKSSPQTSSQIPQRQTSTANAFCPANPAGLGFDQLIPMDNMRKSIAKNMVNSKLTAPHVNSLDEIDMTNIVNFRNNFKETFKRNEGFSLTYTHFIMYAIIQALKEFPYVNASLEGDHIRLKKDINLGCAVAVSGNGLVVPVIKSADSLNITGIARAVNSLAIKARNKKLTLEEMSGGSFTFTNVGSFGTLLATPIILQPQVGIMAAGVIKKRVMVLDNDQMAIRSMMYLTHTYDHRLVDGEQGGKFLYRVKMNLENLELDKLF